MDSIYLRFNVPGVTSPNGSAAVVHIRREDGDLQTRAVQSCIKINWLRFVIQKTLTDGFERDVLWCEDRSGIVQEKLFAFVKFIYNFTHSEETYRRK